MIYFFIKSNEILNGWWNCSCCCRSRCSRDVFEGIIQFHNVIVFMPIKFRWMLNVFALQIYLRQNWNNSQIDSEYGHAWCFIDSSYSFPLGFFSIGVTQSAVTSRLTQTLGPWPRFFSVKRLIRSHWSPRVGSQQSTASIEHFSLIYLRY